MVPHLLFDVCLIACSPAFFKLFRWMLMCEVGEGRRLTKRWERHTSSMILGHLEADSFIKAILAEHALGESRLNPWVLGDMASFQKFLSCLCYVYCLITVSSVCNLKSRNAQVCSLMSLNLYTWLTHSTCWWITVPEPQWILNVQAGDDRFFF